MIYETVISRKTPKIRRPVEKRQYFLKSSLKKKPILLSKGRKFTIGRSGKSSLPIREGTISQKHASIKWERSSFRVKDEGSTNGTFVNNKRISGVTALKDGDRIRMGKFVLRFGIKKVREKAKVRKAAKSKKAGKPAKKRVSRKSTARRRTAHGKTARRKTARVSRRRR